MKFLHGGKMFEIKRCFAAFLLMLVVGIVFAQAEGDYQTRIAASGNWTSATVWQKYSGGIWSDVGTYPSSSDGAINIRTDAALIYNVAVAGGIDQLVVNGSLTIPAGISFITVDGVGAEATVNGTFIQKGTVPVMAGTGVLNSGSTYVHNTTSSATNAHNFFATRAADSTWIYRGSNILVPSIVLAGRSYGNLSFESSAGSWTFSWTGTGVTTVNGNFTLGANVTINHSNTGINVIKGNYTMNGTITYGAGTQNFSFQGVSKTIGGSGTVAFETARIAAGASYTLAAHVGVVSGFTFTIAGTLGCGGFTFTGAGNFTVSAGATFKICHPNGINGNVLVTGTKTYSSTANYEFYGSADQITGSGFPGSVNNLIINTDYTVTLSNSLLISGTLQFIKGSLALGNYSLLGSGNVTGTPKIVFNGTGSANGVGNNITAIITTINPGTLPAIVNTLEVQTGAGNYFFLPNDVATTAIIFSSGGMLLNHSVLTLTGKDIDFHAPDNTTFVTALNVSKTDSPAEANGGNQSISRLWNIDGLSSAPVEITLYWPTPDADTGIVFTDDKGTLWKYNAGSWNNEGEVDIITNEDIRDVSFTADLSAKDSNGDWTISGDGQTLPVELSSFTANLTVDLCVEIAWVAQSEANHSGYNILRAENQNLSEAIKINPILIDNGTQVGSLVSYNYIDQEAYSNMIYYYWLESVALNGSSEFFGPLGVTIGDPNLDPLPPAIPMATKLMNAFPNPFNPNTNIRYSLKTSGKVNISIYNVKGQLIKTFTNEHLSPGFYQVSWDGRDLTGKPMPSGIYLYQMRSFKYNEIKKMILAK